MAIRNSIGDVVKGVTILEVIEAPPKKCWTRYRVAYSCGHGGEQVQHNLHKRQNDAGLCAACQRKANAKKGRAETADRREDAAKTDEAAKAAYLNWTPPAAIVAALRGRGL